MRRPKQGEVYDGCTLGYCTVLDVNGDTVHYRTDQYRVQASADLSMTLDDFKMAYPKLNKKACWGQFYDRINVLKQNLCEN